MNPYFCRTGTKRDMIKVLERHQPTNYTKYVEPFVGGGDVYWSKADEDIPKVINDKDAFLISGYKLLKTGSVNNIERFDLSDLQSLNNLNNAPPTDDTQRLAKIITRTCGTFGGKSMGKIYKPTNPINKLKKVSQYREKMQKTKIMNKDYISILKAEDNPNTYFFIDPPYIESSKGLYKDAVIDPEQMADILSKLKGKFILTIDDTASNRRIFSRFTIRSHIVQAKGTEGISVKSRSDLIIMNY